MISETQTTAEKKKIVFFHPDLGIGGAERLIIDAAVGFQNRGHQVVIFTSHCDPTHCFDEARDGTLDVRVRSTFLIPPSLFSRFAIVLAILRQLYLLVATYITREIAQLQPDAFIVDQLSAGLPVLRYLYPSTGTLFYCHFPDLLLATGRRTWWKRLYRLPFDQYEEWSMGWADRVVVNSKFTKSIVEKTWPQMNAGDIGVVYPCVGEPCATRKTAGGADFEMPETDKDLVPLWKDKKVLLSINRFEEKKGIELAIKAFAELRPEQRKDVRLVIAGGHDVRVVENVRYHQALVTLAKDLSLKTATTKTIVSALNVPHDVDVLFLLSVPDTLKTLLLRTACLLVYTPINEHFGVVPLEAMLAGCPVLASNTGGPLETIVDGKTGWLRDVDDVHAWADVMTTALHGLSPRERSDMATRSRARVQEHFSQAKMAGQIDAIVEAMCHGLSAASKTHLPSDTPSSSSARMMSTTNSPRRGVAILHMLVATVLLVCADLLYLLASLADRVSPSSRTTLPPPLGMTVMAASAWMTYLGLCLGSTRRQ